ncbi:MAG: hypothetical protein ACTSRC_21740 [Candidatus Helarchaeota archaeon]
MNESADATDIKKPTEFLVINDLGPNKTGINIKFRCISKYKETTVTSKRGGRHLRVAEALFGDNTGCILLSLWNNAIQKVQPGIAYRLINGYISIFKGSLRLNIGKYGNLELIEDDLRDINYEKNLSNLIFKPERRPHKQRSYHQKEGIARSEGISEDINDKS